MGFRQGAPLGDVTAHFIDNRRRIILLLFSGKTSPLIEDDFLLRCCVFTLLGLGNRRKEVRAPTFFKDLLSRLTLAIQFPMPFGTGIGRIQDWMIEEWVRSADGVASFYMFLL